MRITPHDIRQQQFTVRMFRGFDPSEERSRGVIEREKNLHDVMVTTQRLVDEMKSAAKREAELIVREAELRGEKAVEAARGEEAKIRVEIQSLKRMRRLLVEDLGATMDRYQRMLTAEGEADGA